jgi:hypothetical protein
MRATTSSPSGEDVIEDELHHRGEDVRCVGRLEQPLVQDPANCAVNVVHHIDLARPVLDELVVEMFQELLGAGLHGVMLVVGHGGIGLG